MYILNMYARLGLVDLNFRCGIILLLTIDHIIHFRFKNMDKSIRCAWFYGWMVIMLQGLGVESKLFVSNFKIQSYWYNSII